MKHYDCHICGNVVNASRLHCNTCGTIPACYSWTGRTVKLDHESLDFIDVVLAIGAERQTARRIIKRVARTVPLDYYAWE